MKMLLKMRFAWALLGALVWFLASLALGPGKAMLDAVKQIIIAVIGFAIALTYFNVSRRVKLTYPDWGERG